MKEPKLTPWIKCINPPVRKGWYELAANYQKSTWMGHYEDGIWTCSNGFRMGDLNNYPESSNYRWRGLANPPKETKQKGEK